MSDTCLICSDFNNAKMYQVVQKKSLPGLLFYIHGIMLKYKNKKGTSVFRQAQTGH